MTNSPARLSAGLAQPAASRHAVRRTDTEKEAENRPLRDLPAKMKVNCRRSRPASSLLVNAPLAQEIQVSVNTLAVRLLRPALTDLLNGAKKISGADQSKGQS